MTFIIPTSTYWKHLLEIELLWCDINIALLQYRDPIMNYKKNFLFLTL